MWNSSFAFAPTRAATYADVPGAASKYPFHAHASYRLEVVFARTSILREFPRLPGYLATNGPRAAVLVLW